MEFGLCCKFLNEPVRFKIYTLSHIKKLLQTDAYAARQKVLSVIWHNINALQQALDYCYDNSILSFRVTSDLIPHLTNLQKLNVLDDNLLTEIQEQLSKINDHGIKLSMHPGQHVNMGSPHKHVVSNSLQDLKEHFFIADLVQCTEINIHIGGTYGDKNKSTKSFINNMRQLIPADKMKYMTIENDELNYSVEDIVSVAKELGIRATYDIHHQRCYNLKTPSRKTEQ